MDEKDGKNSKNGWKITGLIIHGFNRILSAVKLHIRRINKNREGKYSPGFIGLGAALLAALLMVFMLFVPSYLGMSDDGSFSCVANPAGIYHMEDEKQNLYFNYYVREYLSLAPGDISPGGFTSHRLLIYLAKWLDRAFTGDSIFDLRFLAAIYGILFIPAMAMVVKQAARRAETFSESIAVGLLGVVIFADVSYITYFSSFYTETVMYIAILYCVGAALAMQERKHGFTYLVIYTVSGIFMTAAERQYALAGIFLGILGVRFIFIRKGPLWSVSCISSVLLMFLSAIISWSYIPSAYTQTSKYHAMTRGVLFESKNPEETLKEFGIDGSYSILTDTDSNEKYPLIDPENPVLQHGFYDRYNSAEIAYYYLRHPGAMLALLDISVKSAFDVRTGYSGNYEKSAGMPKMAKSLFWSAWSNFKTRSAPKTIGFVFLLLIAAILLFNHRSLKIRRRDSPEKSILLDVMTVIFFIGISQAMLTIIKSGDAELSQHLFPLGITVDILIYFCLSEVLHRLRII